MTAGVVSRLSAALLGSPSIVGTALVSELPTVAVVVPAWNAAEHIADALRSIDGNAPKLTRIVEIVVVDDGSTDNTQEVVERERSSLATPVRLIHQSHQGVAAARNTGIVATNSDLVAFLDADDLWMRGSLDALVAHLLADEEARVVMGGFIRTPYSPGGKADETLPSVDGELTCVFGASLMFRSVFDQVGLLDESMRTGEDFEWFVRVDEASLVRRLTTAVLYYRDRPGSLSSDVSARDRARITFEVLRRRTVRLQQRNDSLSPGTR
jgi:glycosyltransferase involved in cell wall biosynthesis